MSPSPRAGVSTRLLGMLSHGAVLLFVSLSAVGCRTAEAAEADAPEGPEMPAPAPVAYGVEIHRPASLTAIKSTERGPDGELADIRCATCHEIREAPHELPSSADEIGGPHEGLRFDHGSAECASCHHPERYDRLRLATGEAVPLVQAMRLCAQCHGPQKRDYDHGAHGGMRGHWDLASGPRTRNHCVDCHDPHEPAYPRYQPVFPPRDRFLGAQGEVAHD